MGGSSEEKIFMIAMMGPGCLYPVGSFFYYWAYWVVFESGGRSMVPVCVPAPARDVMQVFRGVSNLFSALIGVSKCRCSGGIPGMWSLGCNVPMGLRLRSFLGNCFVFLNYKDLYSVME